MIGPAPLMTSLDMHGFSVSLLPVDDAQVTSLAAPVAPHAWPGLSPFGAVAVRPLPDGLAPIQPVPLPHPARRALIDRCCKALIACEADLNLLDAKSGDGDTGSTLAGAARALEAALDRLPLADPTQLYRAIGMELVPDDGRLQRESSSPSSSPPPATRQRRAKPGSEPSAPASTA
jgi:hypothetical protein